SPRNAAVAGFLNDAGLATLLFDLLTDREAADRGNVFDIPLLGRRLGAVARWLDTRRGTSRLPLGYFGASTGAAAALVAAAEHPDVAAVVSRGGRADLAGEALGAVEAPTLLVVGSHDVQVLELNRQAAAQMNAPVTVEVVPGAGHLFEEPGTLERVAGLAAGFFLRELRSPSA
ncbi:MAG TPA: dienelactone hydrolase family protein, partial [Acidimicrobiia bacterium]|nr:dienelactone hydrolase family protein [Acidimicrobiia bacterium]